MELCECGCGFPAPIATENRPRKGHVKGHAVRFITGHNLTHGKGLASFRWKGGRTADKTGRVHIQALGHPFANQRGYVYEHRLIAEKAAGRILPRSVVIHHVNENPSDNTNNNLVICQDQAYHMLLHQRRRALDLGYPVTWLACNYCGAHDAPEAMWVATSGTQRQYHRSCRQQYRHLLERNPHAQV